MEKPTVFDFSSVHFGQISKLHAKLKEKAIISDPTQKSPPRLVYLDDNGERAGSYYWEFHDSTLYRLVLEAWGSWEGYAHESRSQPELAQGNLERLKITLYRELDSRLTNSIDDIFSGFKDTIKKSA